MTTTPPPPPAESPVDPAGDASDASARGGPRVTGDEVRDLGRLRRSVSDRKVAGVAGGLARHLDVDPIILRVGFVVLAFFGGAGLILYAAGWLLVPEEDRERAVVNLDERSRTIALVALGVVAVLALVGDSWGAYWFPWPLAIIGLLAFLLLSRNREARQPVAPAAGGWTGDGSPVPGPGPAYVPPPRDPRKRGPRLFWFTLLLIAVAEGVLGIVDGAGVAVVDSAYPALAVGIIALMLLVGSVVGRAGGLIALGVVASLALAAGTAADRWDGERYEYHPRSASEVSDAYTINSGELLVDLTRVQDVAALDGRTIEVTGNVGELVVRLPEDMNIEVVADIDGPGGYELFDRRSGGGFGTRVVETWRSAADDPTLTIDAGLEIGQITVETE
jgi:phage shock protein PspC (stress-responsive transcriptional regulator)